MLAKGIGDKELYFVDTETFGFTGPPVLIQYAKDDGPIELFYTFHEPVDASLELIESFADYGIVGFNLTFDWFMLQKWYNICQVLKRRHGNITPLLHIDETAKAEEAGRFEDCVKPRYACDLMLHARKGAYQHTMQRDPIRIRRVPQVIAYDLRNYLAENIQLPEICFAKSKSKDRWKIKEVEIDGEVQKDLVDIVLDFNPSSSLKNVVVEAGLRKKRLTYQDVTIEAPKEVPYAPWALAISEPPFYFYDKGRTWPAWVDRHCAHWKREICIQYAVEDVEDTRNLYYHLGSPEPNDYDSILACMAGSIRWRGYPIDVDKVDQLIKQESPLINSAPRTPIGAKRYLSDVMSEEERKILVSDFTGGVQTGSTILETIEQYKLPCDCPTVTVEEESSELSFDDSPMMIQVQRKEHVKGCKGYREHPAASRATQILRARRATTKVSLLKKLKLAGRFHPAVSVIGSLSGRSSGRSVGGEGESVKSINALGIQRDKAVRSIFLFADDGYSFSSGDFEGQEVSIADAVWGDAKLRKQLTTCHSCGYTHTAKEFRNNFQCVKCNQPDAMRKLHGLFAMHLFPGNSYDDIIKSKNTDHDMYAAGKAGVFGGLMYGGDENTLNRRLGIPVEVAKAARKAFFSQFDGISRQQERLHKAFCSMKQERERGPVTWEDPENKAATIFGFERDFTMENNICKILYNLANHPPKEWQRYTNKVQRYDREQKAINALQSAVFGAAFQIQAGVFRAALNHGIQGAGTEITKRLQVAIWELQPVGVGPWVVAPLGVHDEVDTPVKCGYEKQVEQIVYDFVEEVSNDIPLLKIDWNSNLKNWSEK